ncbi:hypothetical protein PCL1606_09110 [Pseudomonas chlororaphis]|uniref:Uncharacterized protein n=1 Tax=Pseudomonas chlororaphis TaxID=587753 RepID=A0A0D5XTG2_9PSED|nr:hypothetical protein PCL1606_09110 [Pseudomonas chlororaphis]
MPVAGRHNNLRLPWASSAIFQGVNSDHLVNGCKFSGRKAASSLGPRPMALRRHAARAA